MKLEQGTQSLAELAQISPRLGRAVLVAHLCEPDDELSQVLSHWRGLPVVLLSADAAAVAIPALRAGVSAVLEADASEEQVGAAVTGAFHGLVVLPAGAMRWGESRALVKSPAPLTPRELEILSLLAAGDSNKTIAARLSLSVHTIKFHVSSILSKLGVSSRTEAVTLGLRLGIVLL